LKLLVLFGRHVVPANTEVLNLINSVGGTVYTPAKVEKTLHGKPEDLSDAGNTPDMFGLGGLSSLAGLMGLGSGSGSDGGALGGLGGLLGGMPDILKTLGETLGNLDMSAMMNGMNEATTTDPSSETTSDSDEPSAATSETTDAPEGSAAAATDSAAPVPGLFTDLAKEMADTFDFSSMEQGDAPANIGDAFKKFLSGDNPAKLMGLITKFGSKINSEVASGKLNQGDLLKETMGMMQGLGDPEKVKKQAASFAKANPAMAEQLARQQAASAKGGNTKSRLQAKLAARQQGQDQSGQHGHKDKQ